MSYSVQALLADGISGTRVQASFQVTPIDNDAKSERVTLKSSELSFDVSPAPGYIFVVNRGATDMISVGYATGNYEFDLYPGEGIVFRPSASKAVTTIYAVASSTNDVDNFEYKAMQA